LHDWIPPEDVALDMCARRKRSPPHVDEGACARCPSATGRSIPARSVPAVASPESHRQPTLAERTFSNARTKRA
jgi:hypothetical protein